MKTEVELDVGVDGRLAVEIEDVAAEVPPPQR